MQPTLPSFGFLSPETLFAEATTLHSTKPGYLPTLAPVTRHRLNDQSAQKHNRHHHHSIAFNFARQGNPNLHPTYTVRVKLAFVFVVTQLDSLP